MFSSPHLPPLRVALPPGRSPLCRLLGHALLNTFSLFFGLEALSTGSHGAPERGMIHGNCGFNVPFTLQAETPPPPRKSTWRQKHESFIRTLRHARQVQQVIARGGNPSDLPSILPADNPDYVQCPHCSRHFAPKVAERHIPKCKTIKNRPPPPRRHDS